MMNKDASYRAGASQMWQLLDIIISRYLEALEGDMKEVNNIDDARKLFNTLALALSSNLNDILFALNMTSPSKLESVINEAINAVKTND